MNSNIKPVLFVDLDGVMADLAKFISDLTGVVLSNQDKWPNSIWKQFNAVQDRDEPTFSILEKIPDADELWDYVKAHRPNILTATGKRYEHGAREKRIWVQTNLTHYNQIFTVPTSADKAAFAAPHHILIDDRSKSIDPWTEAGGIGILHTDAKSTIKKLQELGM